MSSAFIDAAKVLLHIAEVVADNLTPYGVQATTLVDLQDEIHELGRTIDECRDGKRPLDHVRTAMRRLDGATKRSQKELARLQASNP